jgi:DNA-binding winged helix-turn-helix (wHTH) protein/tetratricopeptide (TPR) repeat protein
VDTSAKTVYRFGPFQVDVHSGELLKQGKRVRIQEQPFRLLILLLENAGDVVSKAEIQNRIWEPNTFVDFDRSQRVAVGKLREALEDDAGSPHYIESIPKRGYRFLAAVTIQDNSIIGESLTGTKPETAGMQPGARTPPKWVFAVGILLLLGLVSATFFFFLHRKRPLTAVDMIVLADFDNKTGEAVFDDTLRQGLAVQLEQSPFLSLTSDDRIQQIVQMMGKPADIRLTPAVAREVCERAGSVAVLDGSIAQIGSQYLLTLIAIDCQSGESLASAEAQANDKNHVLEALGKTASEIRQKLGESLSTVQKLDTPLELATTPSLQALKAFSEAGRVAATTGEAAAIPFYKHAVELDPTFAVAYAYLGIMHTTIGEPAIGAAYTEKAFELKERTSESEKYFISATYFKEVTGNLKRAEQTCALWSHAYPRSEKPHYYLSGAIYPQTGDYEKAVEEGREAVRLNSDSPIPYAFLMSAYIAVNRFDDAKATYLRALGHNLNSPFFHQELYQIAFVQNDLEEMTHQVTWSAGKAWAEDILLSLKAETAAYSGRLREAREISRKAVDTAQRAGEKEAAARYIVQSAVREALLGNAEEARKRASSAMEQSTGRDVQYGAALAFAFAGNDQKARSLTRELAKRFPEDTIVQFNYLPTLRAKLALNQRRSSEALETLEPAAPYELGGTTGSSYGWNALFPVFLRGEAYLRAENGRQAAEEFRKIIDHRGIVVNEPIGVLAHLGLARAYALQGDKPKARAAYQDFLALWKDADPDIPVLKQAIAEFDTMR